MNPASLMHLQYAQLSDLSILDKGYNAFWRYTLYEVKKQSFVCAPKSTVVNSKHYKAFANSGKIMTLEYIRQGRYRYRF